METIALLNNKSIPLFSLNELGFIFGTKSKDSLYKKIARLIKGKILKPLINGKYEYLLKNTNDFSKSNFLYQPSYISLESALSFYSIITQFSYEITAITIKKTKSINIDEKAFSYTKIKPDFFFGYENKGEFLIATPEKALLDYLYLGSKGLRKIDMTEMNLSIINKKTFNSMSRKMGLKYSL